jgi:hypothetical protein
MYQGSDVLQDDPIILDGPPEEWFGYTKTEQAKTITTTTTMNNVVSKILKE